MPFFDQKMTFLTKNIKNPYKSPQNAKNRIFLKKGGLYASLVLRCNFLTDFSGKWRFNSVFSAPVQFLENRIFIFQKNGALIASLVLRCKKKQQKSRKKGGLNALLVLRCNFLAKNGVFFWKCTSLYAPLVLRCNFILIVSKM